jgi:glycosyltransferase involved in cell wall biosynthesis
MPEPVRIGICSTYAPRACGLATFAADLEHALLLSGDVAEVSILAMVEAEGASGELKSPVIAEINEDDADAYVGAAHRANAACDVVIVQHEFGIFGGEDGELVLQFLGALRVPVILTLHTVLAAFSPSQASLLRAACSLVNEVTVFTPTARTLLVRQRIVDEAKVRIVPHGAPSALYEATSLEARVRLGLEDRFVVSTFGLVSPGKGLELAIDAMSRVVAVVPSAVLVIAGRTHPGENRRNGERYRSGLVAQVSRLGLDDHVRFIDSFLSVEEIADVLAATDVFVTPYINADQIVSGALTFAVAAGCPVVSTGYLYACDLLTSGAGTVVEGRDAQDFAKAVLSYATDEEFREAARSEARRIGEGMRWTAIGNQIADVAGVLDSRSLRREPALHVVGIDHVRVPSMGRRSARRPLVSTRSSGLALAGEVQAVGLGEGRVRRSVPQTHLRRLIDSTGIVQHATGIVPLLSSGYCVDDVARVVPVAYQLHDDAYWGHVTARSVAFIANAIDPEGKGSSTYRGELMHNFMSFDRRWLDHPTFGDHVGRAALGLSSVVHDERYAPLCEPILRSVFRDLPSLGPIHPVGYSLLAQSAAPWLTSRDRVAELVSVLLGHLRSHTHDSWLWFENSVRYDAAMLVEALLAGGVALDDDSAVDEALTVLRWLDSLCDLGDHVRFPGHRGMRRGQTTAGTGDEQPLEALALVRAHARAWETTGDRWFRDRAAMSHAWFAGHNRLGLAVADEDGGCFDGLSDHDVNRNQGAESTLAYVASALIIERIHRVGTAAGLRPEAASPAAGQ